MAINLAAPKGDKKAVALAAELVKKLSGKAKCSRPRNK